MESDDDYWAAERRTDLIRIYSDVLQRQARTCADVRLRNTANVIPFPTKSKQLIVNNPLLPTSAELIRIFSE